MVFLAADALNFTTTAITKTNSTDIQTEVSLAEEKIRTAASFGIFTLGYNASIIGNPAVDPRTTTNLPPNQLTFYNQFTAAGYVVGLDSSTGQWFFSWSATGAENLVGIYSFRTTFNPSSITTQTLNAITAYFQTVRPVVHSTSRYNGTIDEAGFGGVTSTFWEFTTAVDQGADLTNYSALLKTYIIAQGLGYTTNNSAVYQMIA